MTQAKRRPLSGQTSQASAAGDAMVPGMAMPPQAGMVGGRPASPMGGSMPDAPGGFGNSPIAQDLMQQMMPADTNAGGPDAPFNIGAMLQPNQPPPNQQQQGAPGSMPGQPPQPAGTSMPPWGSEGTQPPMMDPMQSAAMAGEYGAPDPMQDPSMQPPTPHVPGILLKLMKAMGKY